MSGVVPGEAVLRPPTRTSGLSCQDSVIYKSSLLWCPKLDADPTGDPCRGPASFILGYSDTENTALDGAFLFLGAMHVLQVPGRQPNGVEGWQEAGTLGVLRTIKGHSHAQGDQSSRRQVSAWSNTHLLRIQGKWAHPALPLGTS